MLTVHHLGISQSERIVWLCEELGVEYTLKTYSRDPVLSPQSLKDVPGNEMGTAPFVEDDSNGAKLTESGAIAEYISTKYANGKLQLKPDDSRYADYVQWFHYSNGTLQPALLDYMFISNSDVSKDDMFLNMAESRLEQRYKFVNEHLGKNKYFAGDELTLADIMTVYTLTTQRYWGPQSDLNEYKNILRYLKDISEIPSYKRAMEKGDPQMKLLITGDAPESLIVAGGVTSDVWKK